MKPRFASLLWMLPALTALLVYWPALGGDFVWDDDLILLDQPFYRDPALIGEALRHPFSLSPNYFRPLVVLSFYLESRVWGPNPFGYHLTNVLLHVVNTLLVYSLARRFLGDGKVALAVGLAFAVHPVHVEAVAWVAGRFDLLTGAFLLLALWLATGAEGQRSGRMGQIGRGRASARRCLRSVAVLIASLAFFLALLAKEMAIAFPLTLFALQWGWGAGERTKRGSSPCLRERSSVVCRLTSIVHQWPIYLALALAGLAYLALRYATLGYLVTPQPDVTLPVGSAVQHLLLVARSAFRYLLVLIWPFGAVSPLQVGPAPVPVTFWPAWLELAALLLLLAALLRCRPGRRCLGALAAFFAAALPVLNVLPLELAGGPFVADRFLYWPSFLFLLALGSAAKEMKEWRLEIKSISKIQLPFSILYSLISIWLLGCAVVTLLLVPRWRSDVSFWEWAARQAPESPMPPTNLALEYAEAGRLDEALAQAERAIAMDPASATAWVNLGLTHFRAGRFGDAETAFARAVELKPGHALFWNDLAGALREQSRLAEAEAILVKEALPRDPYLAATHLNLGVVYLRTDRPDLAARHLQEALRLLPPAQAGEAADLLAQTREPTAWLRLGDGLLAHDDPRGALAAFEQAASLGAPAIDALVGRGAALITLRDWPAATATLQAALILAPQEPRLYNNLGVLARAQGNLAEARRYFTAAAKLAPTWELPRQNLQALGGQ